MFTLVIGGSASGKSRYAEALVQAQPGPRIYLATMQPFDAECEARIARHREQRAGKGFETIECYGNLKEEEIPQGGSLLLEDLSNLLANELYSPEGRGAEAILPGIEHLLERCANVTVVTNEVFSGGSDYEGDTLRFLWELAALNRELAARADRVVELVCGLEHVLKGERHENL